MKQRAVQIGVILGSLILNAAPALANVSITQPSAGQNLSSDKAADSTNGSAFTAIGNIVITEGAMTDFAAGANQTLILTAPANWRFNAGVGTVSYTTGKNITAATIAVTSSNITITYSIAAATYVDTLTIGGVQVQPVAGAGAPNPGYITRSPANPGTGVIAGIVNTSTRFAFLSTLPGTPRSLKIKTQPGAAAVVGDLFNPQPVVSSADQFGNACYMDVTTVITASRASGTATLRGALTNTVIGGDVIYTNLYVNSADTITLKFSASNLGNVISSPITITPAPADHLVFSVQPGSAGVGAPFGVQPVVRAVDSFGNFTTYGLATHQDVTLTLTSGNGTLLGKTTEDIGMSGGIGIATFSGLEIDTMGTNYQLTASSAGFASVTSSKFAVSAGPVTSLQLLMPGEVAAPGTPSGKTGTPTAQTAGATFNVIVNAMDAFGNLNTTATHTINLSASDSNAALPANTALVNGTKTLSVTLKTAGTATLTASDISNPAIPASSSPVIAVNAGAFSKLQILAPGETAAPGAASGKIGSPAAQTAGTSFDVIVNAVDANWNLISGGSDVVGLTASDANATLPANVALVGGTATLTLTPVTAGASTVTAKDITDTTKASNTSSAIAVAAADFAKLQILVAGETAAPGTVNGKIGAPLPQNSGEVFPVTVNAVDAYWNKVSTVVDMIDLSSSDAVAVMPADAALTAGSRTYNIALQTSGASTLTATDLTDVSRLPVTSSAISVTPPLYTAATGGSAISADTTGGAYTALVGPVYTEVASSNVGVGTIILKAPAGFVFCTTNSPAPSVLINNAGGKTYNINGVVDNTAAAMTSKTTTQMVFTVTKMSSGGYTSKLTWQNLKIRPAAGTPLASGKLTIAGTAVLKSVSTNSNLGSLQEVPGAVAKFSVLTQPSTTATAGVPFAQQPVVQVTDKFGNLRPTDSTTVVTASRGAGSGTLQGTTTATASAGVASFANLSHNVATNITLVFSATGATNSTSSSIAVSGADVASLAFAVQPGNATAGSVFGTQPVVVTVDAFGNRSINGLAKSQNVNIALDVGTSPLQGTVTADIGTMTGNGVLSFTDLRLDTAGPGQQLKATANGLTKGLSSAFTVNAGAASQLTIKTQPAATAKAGAAFSPQPAIAVLDVFGNLRTQDNSTVVTVARNSGIANLLGTKTATAVGGVATFANLSCTNMGAIDLSFTSGALTPVISSVINVGPGPARKLVIATQPSATATAGQPFAQQPQVNLVDQYGNFCANDSSSVVTAARASGTGTLRGTTSVTVNAGVAAFADLNYPLAQTMTIQFSSPGATNATSTSVVVTADVFSRLLVLAPGETAAPGTLTGKSGTPATLSPATPFTVTVKATDNNWNALTNVTDTVQITSSDLFATLPANAALVAGTKQFSVALSEAGFTNTVTASDVTDATKLANTSSWLSVVGRFASASGGNPIFASTAGVSFTSLTGPTYSEAAAGGAGKGTVILNAPDGFVFDTGGVAPTVKIDRLTSSGKGQVNINGVTNGASVAMSSVTSTQLVFTISTASSGTTCKMTWQNVRVQPVAASPLALGKLTKTGTSVMSGVTNSLSNFGTLNEVSDVAFAAAAAQMGGAIAESDLLLLQAADAGAGSTGSDSGTSGDVSTPVVMNGIAPVEGGMQITLTGAPGYTYQVMRATSLGSSADWQVIGAVTTDAQGNGTYTDTSAPADHGFYRTKQ